MKTNKLSLGIVGGGPKSWIGHVHRISARLLMFSTKEKPKLIS